MTLVRILYTNWRGERRMRLIRPIGIAHQSTPWHPKKQWVLHAHDEEKQETRLFAMNAIEAWREK
jgi:predicted DNA-binding transcriptional regulator YafY